MGDRDWCVGHTKNVLGRLRWARSVTISGRMGRSWRVDACVVQVEGREQVELGDKVW
jgi:hypothetical protein